MTTEAETGVMQWQAMESAADWWPPPEARKDSTRGLRGSMALLTPRFPTPGLQAWEGIHLFQASRFVAFGHSKPEETKTANYPPSLDPHPY